MAITGDLCSDIVGTNPSYPKIVDQDWLNVDLAKYDNYPSDNNPVRVVPKLHDLWNHASNCGLNLVPNAQVMPLGVRSSDEDFRTVDQIVKEAKKAVMAGLKGKALSDHIRSRFSSKHIVLAQENLKKIAEEIGLLGNVYIDASAFNTYDEAEKFLSQHRNRLARDILMNTEGLSHSVISMLASDFHKNVVAEVKYDESTLKKYRDYLVQSKRIPEDMIIASKEDLRGAFLFVWPEKEANVQERESKKIDGREAAQLLEGSAEQQAIINAEQHDSILLHKITPVVSFVQKNLSDGKAPGSIKEMVKSKFASVDIKDAAEALAITLSKEGLSEANVEDLIKEGKISLVLGKELKRIGKLYPRVEAQKFEGVKTERQIGVQGYEYFMNGKKTADKNENLRKAAVEALKKGYDFDSIKKKMLEKLSAEEAETVFSEAIGIFNSMPAGMVANKRKKAPKARVEEPAPKQTLPDPSTIASQLDEITATFDGSLMNEIPIDAQRDLSPVEVSNLFNREGLDKSIT